MFTVGQLVWHRDGRRSGRVLECEGDRVFIEQENGAEADFAAADLTATPPASAAKPQAAKPGGGKPGGANDFLVPSRTLIAADITPEHVRVLGLVPARTVQAVAALYERRNRPKRFDALGTAEKLNVIAEITAVPYRTMRDYSDRPGELGLMMGKGLADAQRAG
jgi:hypothetical protein